jgi:hypothetical protein
LRIVTFVVRNAGPEDVAAMTRIYDALLASTTIEWTDELHRSRSAELAGGGVPQLRSLPPGATGSVFAADESYLGVDTIDPVRQDLVSHHVSFGAGRTAKIFRTPHRYVWPAELDLMGQIAGFELESRRADWMGTGFSAESASHVSVYQLPS